MQDIPATVPRCTDIADETDAARRDPGNRTSARLPTLALEMGRLSPRPLTIE